MDLKGKFIKYSSSKLLVAQARFIFLWQNSEFRHRVDNIPSLAPILRQRNQVNTTIHCGPGSVVGIETGYGLDGPGIESQWGRDFPHLSRPALGPTQPPVRWVSGLSWGQRTAEAWRWPHSPFSQERVGLYLYSLYGPYALYRASVPVQGCTLPFLKAWIWNNHTNSALDQSTNTIIRRI
jgi:hypothetical protein